MKYAQRMILISEAEYLDLKRGRKSSMADLLREPRDINKYNKLLGAKLKKKKKLEAKPSFIDFIPPVYHSEAKILTRDMSWNDRFELITSSGAVPGSNIADLVKEALIKRTLGQKNDPNPVGWDVFIHKISQSTLPASFFKRQSIRQQLIELRGGLKWVT